MTSTEVQRAAKFVRESLATERDEAPLAPLRFAERLSAHRAHRARMVRVGIPALLGVMVLGVGLTAVALRPEKLTYRIDGSSNDGVPGSYISAPPAASLALHFSEGSQVVLGPHARGRVAQTGRHGATVVIEDGQAQVAIVHRHDTSFHILAGPFDVNVTGTRFDVAFDVVTQTFALKMKSGTVRVTGPGLREPVEVRDTSELLLSAKPADGTSNEAASALSAAPAVSAAQVESTKAQAEASQRNALPEEATAKQRSAPLVKVPSESFVELDARGQHQRIVDLAEQYGTSNIIAKSNPRELLALGNAARFTGRYTLSTNTYRALRERFAHSREALASAFYLGRLLESSAPDQAISWYERYSSESPGGDFVADALGRRVVLLQRSQPGIRAETAASEYLSRFPNGPYAGFARKLLSP